MYNYTGYRRKIKYHETPRSHSKNSPNPSPSFYLEYVGLCDIQEFELQKKDAIGWKLLAW